MNNKGAHEQKDRKRNAQEGEEEEDHRKKENRGTDGYESKEVRFFKFF